MTAFYLLGIAGIVGLYWSIFAGSSRLRTPAEKAQDDQAQVDWLRDLERRRLQ
ncbi:MAG TPA: hypothetical protein VHN99_00635 [Deinococcales bacterium]|nr:hypothetical protein [Deinococcales bacterium]